MRRSLHAEWIKLRTARMPWGLFAAGVLLTVLVLLLVGFTAGTRQGKATLPSLGTLAGQGQLFTSTQFALLLSLVLGVLVAAGEFRHGTATPTALATPRRVQVLAAKEVAGFGLGLAFGLAAAATTVGLGMAFIATKGDAVLIPTSTILRDSAGAVLGGGLLGAAGVATGSLIRSQIGAIVIALVWCLGVEASLSAVVPACAPYLPYTAVLALAGQSSLAGGVSSLAFPAAFFLVAGVITVLAALASRTTLLRDIT